MSENGQETKIIELPVSITVRDLAQTLDASPIEVIKTLMANGMMANINQEIDFDTAAIVSAEMGYEALPIHEEVEEQEEAEVPLWRKKLEEEDEGQLVNRPPVVAILGHVDHGKTSLLDAIRQTSVQAGEAGGITQHIGAYQIVHEGKTITFLDTPGHAAFTAMRARGAQGADIVVLVVAADDGVMPQTEEAIAHARAAQVSMIVALNKIDKDNAAPDRVKQQLADIGIVPDDWEGDTIIVPVSAVEKIGLDDLIEAILLVADDLDILANPEGDVFGTVIEAELTKGRGVMATLLVQNGTLKVGDTVLAGTSCGRIKAMFDYTGAKIKEAGPSVPVSVMGLSDVPKAGELFSVVANEKVAREIIGQRVIAAERAEVATDSVANLEQLFARVQAGEEEELRLIIKADVQGSLEPIVTSVQDLKSGGEQDIGVKVIHAGTGNISNDDIMLASATKSIIIGFNVGSDSAAKRLADTEGISIRKYKIIYHLIEDIEKALKGMLEPVEKKILIGRAQVLAVFPSGKYDQVAGCRVETGEIRRNAKIRVLREGKIAFEGGIASLKRHKDDVNEVREGFECGIGLKGFSSFEEGDILESYVIEMVSEF
ncbi:MAG TPA: translation initiation factor IF-2 [Chloroflexi bacterium]|nr:MAG: translation initiation factor IF-2 [Chloroflexota bacterium]HDD55168.1 translation initiation factor IF-2 [Chloroflexota bacterium]